MADPVNTGFDTEFSDPLAKFRAALAAQGIQTNIFSGVRDNQKQAQLYANWQAGRAGQPLPYPALGPVPLAAPPGTSLHERGLAADIKPADPADLPRMRALASQYGLQTLKNDPYHFQLANWRQAEATQPPNMAWDQTSPANVPSQYAMNMEGDASGGQATPSRPGNYGQTGVQLLNAELAKRGIGPDAASGAIAGIMGESGANLDPRSFNTKDPGGGSGGIGQWNRGRLVGDNGLLAFAKSAGVPVDINNPLDATKVPLAIQAQYVGHELDTTYSGVANQLKAAKSPQDALGIWVNSYERPADPGAAIAQRSQYLAPVGAVIGGAAPQAPGPMDPSAQAGGPGAPLGTPGSTVNPPIPTTPGLTINSNPMASLGGKIGDLAGNLQKDLGKSDEQAKPDIKPLEAPPAPPARNVSPLLGNPQIYAQRMAALNQPMTWGGAPPGQMYGAGYGPQNQPVYGTSLMSQLQMLSDPTWMNQMAGG